MAIGRAVLSGPHFLLMDEPLSSLDKARREEIMLVIERIATGLNCRSSMSAMTAQRWNGSLTLIIPV